MLQRCQCHRVTEARGACMISARGDLDCADSDSAVYIDDCSGGRVTRLGLNDDLRGAKGFSHGLEQGTEAQKTDKKDRDSIAVRGLQIKCAQHLVPEQDQQHTSWRLFWIQSLVAKKDVFVRFKHGACSLSGPARLGKSQINRL